jgi:hypothetical protein
MCSIVAVPSVEPVRRYNLYHALLTKAEHSKMQDVTNKFSSLYDNLSSTVLYMIIISGDFKKR